jgi:hypothetical protein
MFRKNAFAWIDQWKKEIGQHYKAIVFSLFLLAVASAITYNAGVYVTEHGEAVASDFILDHFGPYDWNFLFVYVWLGLVFLMVLYPLLWKVDMVHKMLEQFSFLMIVRSLFITLTHLKTPTTQMSRGFPGALSLFEFQNDLFFSGHTAVPFLAFLVFKDQPIRWVFLAGSLLMATTVLAMHEHYSIDVFAAYFITYGCYKLAQYFSPFKK